ncbi:MAG: alpha/beta fold hydrolase [Chloroflexota bacterium]
MTTVESTDQSIQNNTYHNTIHPSNISHNNHNVSGNPVKPKHHQTKKVWITVTLALIVSFVALNAVAFNQARAMLTFSPIGERTASPEALSFLGKVEVLLFGVVLPKPMNQATPAEHGLAFETHTIDVGDVDVGDDIKLDGWYIPKEGSKGLVVLFHGYGGEKSGELPSAVAFHHLGYSTFLVDFRGSGGSSGYQTSVGYWEAIDVVETVQYVEKLEKGPIILVGRSMGGAAVLRAVDLGMIDPDGLIIEAVFDDMLSTVKNRFDVMNIPTFPAAHLLVFWAGQQIGVLGFTHNPADYAQGVKVPVLMLHGAHDTRVTLTQAERLFDQIGSQDKRFELFTESSHADILEKEPQKWRQVIQSFLDNDVAQPD